jgi:glycerol-3-phosphate dehydrogenase (NAD(P)+)
MKNVCVLGGGSWGIAVARLLFDNGHHVSIWEFNPKDAETLRQTREHAQKLPGIRLPDKIAVTSDLKEASQDAEIICFVIPSHTVRQTASLLDAQKVAGKIYVNCAKGIEGDTGMRMSEVIAAEIEDAGDSNIVTLSGPSHAEEVAEHLPTSVVVAGESAETAETVQRLFNNEYFRVYTSPHILSVELGGSVKNIIAIASGICHGLGFGDNTGGALITRGLAEIVRLGDALGGDAMTFAGLSGLGDLVTTCLSRHSRNRHVGERIGRGETLTEILSSMVMVAEGVNTTKSVYDLSRRLGVEMPITEQVYRVLFEEKDPLVALRELMTRDLKSEN